jgi:hypothetical protein
LLAVVVHPASVQDRDGAEDLLREARRSFPFIERLIGDAGYQGPKIPAKQKPGGGISGMQEIVVTKFAPDLAGALPCSFA